MKKVILLILMAFSLPCFAEVPSINEVRSLYQKAASEERYCKELISLLKPYTERNNPLLSGYKACATMMMAKYAFSPISKLSYFKKGRSMLEKAIEADPNDVELRFLRFGVQTNAPSFLGYRNHIETDKAILLRSVFRLNDDSLKKMIVTYLKSSGNLTSTEKQKLTL